MTALAAALALVGLAAVLAAWSVATRAIALGQAQARASDIEAVRADVERVEAVAKAVTGTIEDRLAELEGETAALKDDIRRAGLAQIGGRRR